MDCWRALTELDAKAQEAQELRNQLKANALAGMGDVSLKGLNAPPTSQR